MKIAATVTSKGPNQKVVVATEGNEKSIEIPSKSEGRGSAINGGELLFLALATCYCNDVYREASKRRMEVASVDVTDTGHFGSEGEPASNIQYNVSIQAPAHSPEQIQDLAHFVDKVAEVHNTLRKGVSVTLSHQGD